jgi:hypothetical protein
MRVANRLDAPSRALARERGLELLLAVLLNARCAQSGEAVLIDRVLPGQELFDRQGVAAAGFFERQ